MPKRISLTKHYVFDRLIREITSLQPGMTIEEVQRELHSPHTELADDICQYDESGFLLDSVLLQACRGEDVTALRITWVSLVAADGRLPIVLRAMSESSGKLNESLYATSKIQTLLSEKVQVGGRKAASNLAQYFEQARIFVPKRHGSEIVGAQSAIDTESAIPLCVAHLAVVLSWENPLESAVELGVHTWLNITETRFKELASGVGVTVRAYDEAAKNLPIAVPRDPPRLDLAYVVQAEDVGIAVPRPRQVDGDTLENATQEHRKTQNDLATWARTKGCQPVRPDGNPRFDVGWRNSEYFLVAEVKSLGMGNERGQVRLGLGQVLDYRKQLRDKGVNAIAVLVVSRKPVSDHWGALARELGVLFSWPPFEALDRWVMTNGR